MTDAELEQFLGIAGKKGCAEIMAAITPEQRATYEHMAEVEEDIRLWQLGVKPLPPGVIVCHDHKPRRIKRRPSNGSA